jgi:four helix bundle protein
MGEVRWEKLEVKNNKMRKRNELSKRLLIFAVRIIKFLRLLPKSAEYNVIRYQLIKSATSSGANYDEAQSGSSKADFHNKVNISLKEMSESNYWLEIIRAVIDTDHDKEELFWLMKESDELEKILASIVLKTGKIN